MYCTHFYYSLKIIVKRLKLCGYDNLKEVDHKSEHYIDKSKRKKDGTSLFHALVIHLQQLTINKFLSRLDFIKN